MESILQKMLDCSAEQIPNNFVALVDTIRPRRVGDVDTVVNNLRALAFLLEQNAEYRHALESQLRELFNTTRQAHLYTDTGIFSNEPLLTALRRRIGERILPLKPRSNILKDVFGLVFYRKDDYVWLSAIPYAVWAELYRSLRSSSSEASSSYSRLQMLEAIHVLSCRIATIGLEPELVQNAPDMQRFESPFVRQNVETQNFVENYRKALTEKSALDDDAKQIWVLLDQCADQVVRVRKHALRYGVSVSLTYHLLRLEQHIERMRLLLQLVDPVPSPSQGEAVLRLFLQLAKAENRKNSLRDVLRQNTELLALQVTEHASHTGEHYITDSRREWFAMFRSAAGAGLIIGCMALFKVVIAKLHLPPLIETLAFGLNYGICFVVVHLAHCTIATKQPAMTAATIAATLPPSNSKGKEGYLALVELMVKVSRTQFVAIVGNVVLTMLTAFFVSWLWRYALGLHLADLKKSNQMLFDLRPITGYGVPHAAIAGFWLFVAGLISGYYDNQALYRRIPERIAAHPLLLRIFGESRTQKFGTYIEHNLGALAGNFYFGFLLGMTGFIGFLFGLPLDIRHITFSSAYLAFAIVGNDFDLSWSVMLAGFLGVALIGLTNLAVSFAFALWTAMRSRQRFLTELLPLPGMLLKRFLSHPMDFFVAPRNTKKFEEGGMTQDGDGSRSFMVSDACESSNVSTDSQPLKKLLRKGAARKSLVIDAVLRLIGSFGFTLLLFIGTSITPFGVVRLFWWFPGKFIAPFVSRLVPLSWSRGDPAAEDYWSLVEMGGFSVSCGIVFWAAVFFFVWQGYALKHAQAKVHQSESTM